MRVYIAGPYTATDPVINTRHAVLAAEYLMEHDARVVPFVPHLSLAWHLISPHSVEWWYAYDLAWLRVCDIVLRLPGASTGADLEVAEAKKLGIPVFTDVAELLRSIR